MRQLLVAVSLVSVAAAQANWWQPTLSASPPFRYSHAMTTEPVSGRVVMFGGCCYANDTWEWDGNTWVQTGLANAPSPRETHAMAADGQGGIILFGGSTGSDETWRYFQGQWTALSPATIPPPRRGHNMVSTGQGILMFGGYYHDPQIVTYGDTWEWNGTNWVQRFPSTTPPARTSPGMAYDPVRGRVVMHGGGLAYTYPITPLDDTWEWDGNNWQQMFPQRKPLAHLGVPMAFASDAGRIVAYGGFVPDATGTNIEVAAGCWTWDGTDWTEVVLNQPNPGARASPLVWSPISHGLMMFAGHGTSSSDTWLTGPWVGLYEPFGSGCADPTGVTPSLAAVPSETPRRGTTSHVRVSNLPVTLTLPVFVIGFSAAWDPAGYPLPLDLGVLGWPGCPQLVSAEILEIVLGQNGQADYPITVPANYSPGFTFFVQTLVLYFPTGTAVSNAVTGIVGY